MKKIEKIGVKDILDIFIFVICFPISIILRIYFKIINKKIWLLSEDGYEAKDNAYSFYKYLKKIKCNRRIYYVIDKRESDSKKILASDIVIPGSIKHFLLYMSSTFNITTQKHGNPSKALFYILQKLGYLKKRRIFLQHGITMNDVKFLYYKQTTYRLFICATLEEKNYILNKFGYPKENVECLGFSRFDDLVSFQTDKTKIVLMPSWRSYLAKDDNLDFKKTEYFSNFNKLINDKQLIKILEEKGITLYFYPHRNMQKYISIFKSISKNVKIVDSSKEDIQSLIGESALMITDYSSVSLDFAYLNKPLIYFQFDQEKFREGQYDKGYFDYEKNGFGPVLTNEKEVSTEIIKIVNKNYINEDKYQNRINKFFDLRDSNNSKRIYDFLIRIEG